MQERQRRLYRLPLLCARRLEGRQQAPSLALGIALTRVGVHAVGHADQADPPVGVALFAVLLLIPAYVQAVQGMSATEAGLVLLPQGLVMAAGTILGDVLSRRQQVRGAAIGGTAILALTTSALLLIQATTPAW